MCTELEHIRAGCTFFSFVGFSHRDVRFLLTKIFNKTTRKIARVNKCCPVQICECLIVNVLLCMWLWKCFCVCEYLNMRMC